MLLDRSYMRQMQFAPRRSATVMLLIANVAAFLLQTGLDRFTSFPVVRDCALSRAGLEHGYVWQLLTYQFMHANLLHLLVNCWALYVFGLAVEAALGRKTFVTLYFASGVVGGLFQTLAGFTHGAYANEVVGASAAVFGLVAAFAMLFPDRVFLFLFVIPIRAKFLVVVEALVACYGMVFARDGIAHAAHMGGMLTGIYFIRLGNYWHWHWPARPSSRSPLRPRQPKFRAASPPLQQEPPTFTPDDLPDAEFLSQEVDPVLDKISAHGIQSLTARERRILETARAKMAKR
jgi:membrane associated rhomboid family serine protease